MYIAVRFGYDRDSARLVNSLEDDKIRVVFIRTPGVKFVQEYYDLNIVKYNSHPLVFECYSL